MRRAQSLVVGLCVTVFVISALPGSAVAASANPTAAKECSALNEGSEGGAASCAQGYEAAAAGKPEVSSCQTFSTGPEAVAASENTEECRLGWAFATKTAGPSSAKPSSTAEKECSALDEGSEGGVTTCEQGYEAANAGKPEVSSCLTFSTEAEAVVPTESIEECRLGWASATKTAGPSSAKPSSTAEKECAALDEGSEGGVAVCEQGYEAAKAGKPEVSSCLTFSTEAEAVAASESTFECRLGWAAG
jgi:hypothetical protein